MSKFCRHTSRLLSALLLFGFLVFGSSDSFATGSHSPVGTWQMTISGGNQGIAFLTFNSDYSMTGYGMNLGTYGLFAFTGTWTIDAKGNTAGTYTEYLGGESFQGSFAGKATNGKTLVGKSTGNNGTATLSGTPATTTPDISGNWVAYITQDKITIPDFVTLTPDANYPGVFVLSGNGSGPDGAFTLSGGVIISSKGKAVVVVEADYPDETVILSTLVGNFNLRSQTGSFTGATGSGDRVRAKVVR
jgi:hypothetical protein